MDVRCERCRAEYDFDEAKITEAGVTVKCTSCGHVFKVRKKALVVTEPVKAAELEPLRAAPAAPQTEKAREWKVRQANGNVFTFKELTTLQKWIVERKVSRDDEISLTGDSWKRLGNIPELASFFQVVEAADRAAVAGVFGAPSYPQPGPMAFGYPPVTTPGPMPSVGMPVTTPSPMPAVMPTGPVATPGPMLAVPSAPGMAPPSPSPVAGFGFPAQGPLAMGAPVEQPRPEPVAATPRPVRQPDPALDSGELDPSEIAAIRGSGKGKFFVVVLLLGALVGGAGYVFKDRFSGEAAVAAGPDASVPEPPDAAAPGLDASEPGLDASLPDAGEPPDAAEPPDASEIAKAKTAKEPPERGFSWYIEQAYRKRERGHARQALELAAQAAELDAENPEVLTGIGYCELDLGNLAAAQRSFEEAIGQNPRFLDAILGLAETYRERGNKAKAAEFYKRYLDVAPSGPEAEVARANLERLGKE